MTIEVYIDDMLAKSLQVKYHLRRNIFSTLQKYNMKPNPEKCAFGMALGKFLGFLVSNREIEVNIV